MYYNLIIIILAITLLRVPDNVDVISISHHQNLFIFIQNFSNLLLTNLTTFLN